MPSSHFRKIPSIIGILDYLGNVRSILDVGAGYGKYGIILREHMDIRKGRFHRKDWLTTIDAVEPNNLNILNPQPYNTIYTEPIQDLLTSISEYDLIILSDVIEYIDKDQNIIFCLSRIMNYIILVRPCNSKKKNKWL